MAFASSAAPRQQGRSSDNGPANIPALGGCQGRRPGQVVRPPCLPLGATASGRQFGLEVAYDRIPGIGYRPEGLARGTLTRYDSGLRKLDTVLRNWEPEVQRKRDRSAIALICSCQPPRRMRMSPGVVALGPVVCGEPFTPASSSPGSA
jgi:hypothetical protein